MLVDEYLDQLQEPYKSKAKYNRNIYFELNPNMKQKIKDYECSSLPGALSLAFPWNKSIEGWDYWYNLYINLQAIEIDKKLCLDN